MGLARSASAKTVLPSRRGKSINSCKKSESRCEAENFSKKGFIPTCIQYEAQAPCLQNIEGRFGRQEVRSWLHLNRVAHCYCGHRHPRSALAAGYEPHQGLRQVHR